MSSLCGGCHFYHHHRHHLHRHHCLFSLGWSSASGGAEEIFCNRPNKLKTENVNLDASQLYLL